jgi:C-terminal processing protease CtpA/Prc
MFSKEPYVSTHFTRTSWLAPLAASAVFSLGAPFAVAQNSNATPLQPGDGDVEAQMQAARKQLEQAAHEIAQLSAQMSGEMLEHVMPLAEAGHAILGVQLERTAGAGGARVREVSPGGPAAQAGIQVGDVIVAVNGTELKGERPARQVLDIMRDVKPDTKVAVRVLHDGQTRDMTVTARAAPALVALPDMSDLNIDLSGLPNVRGAFMLRGPLADMELATVTPHLGSYFGAEHGVLVVRAPADGVLNLEDGDVILAIDGREPSSGSHATRILGSYQPGEKITLRIIRQHKTQELTTALPESGSRGRERAAERRAAGAVQRGSSQT